MNNTLLKFYNLLTLFFSVEISTSRVLLDDIFLGDILLFEGVEVGIFLEDVLKFEEVEVLVATGELVGKVIRSH